MIDADTVTNPQRYRNNPEDIQIRIRINPEMCIWIQDHIWLLCPLTPLGDFCPPYPFAPQPPTAGDATGFGLGRGLRSMSTMVILD